MPIYKIGQGLHVSIQINMKILRAFSVQDIIYYIVLVQDPDKLKTKNNSPIYAVLRHDDTSDVIPSEVMKMADNIVIKEKLLENLE